MSLTAEQANALLDSITTKEQLRDLINQLDINSGGSTTVLYSGNTVNGLDNFQILQGMLHNGDDIRVIDNTEAAKFLNVTPGDPNRNDVLEEKLQQIFGDDPNERNSRSNQFLFGERTADGTRFPNGAWDNISARFVDATVGEVRTLTGGASVNGVFNQTELPRLLNNPNITSVDGLPLSDLQRLGPAAAFQAISAQSDNLSGYIKVAIDADGRIIHLPDGVPRLDSRQYFGLTGVEGKPPLVDTGRYGSFDRFIPERRSGHVDGARLVQEIKDGYQSASRLLGPESGAARANALRVLGKMGVAADLLSLATMVHDANAAYARGDTSAGNTIVQDWTSRYLGGLMGGLMEAQAVGSLLTPLYMDGPAGAIFASILTLAAGVEGTFLGSHYLGDVLNKIFDQLHRLGQVSEQALHDWITHMSDAFQRLANQLHKDSDAFMTLLHDLFGYQRDVRDPLVLDLDGDGIETVAAGKNILFDHDGDGIKHASGWIKSDDGLLVLDRNGNGHIDDGSELFGADTLLANGQKATSGFEALRDLDSNGDGVFDAGDTRFTDVRVWRDLNQDGRSQTNELFTLSSLGIASIALTPTDTQRVNLNDGNFIDGRGTYTRSDGRTGVVGNLQLGLDHFYRDYNGAHAQVTVSEAARALPAITGSGAVRDLQEAASQSPALLAAVQALLSGTTPGTLRAALDQVIALWADTSTMRSSEERLEASGDMQRNVYYQWFVPAAVIAQGQEAVQTWTQQQHARLGPIIGILEKFNGSTLVSDHNGQISMGGQIFSWNRVVHPDGHGEEVMTFRFLPEQFDPLIDPFTKAYAHLKESIYIRLVLQQRLSDYLSGLTMTYHHGVMGWDASGVHAKLDDTWQHNKAQALQDAMDLYRYGSDALAGSDWKPLDTLRDMIDRTAAAPDGIQALKEAGTPFVSGDLEGSAAADIMFGDAGANTLSGGAGDDVLSGGGGDDTLYGGEGNDILRGDAGNDLLYGSSQNNTYLFNQGDGHDTLVDQGGSDTIVFGTGIAASDIRGWLQGQDVVLDLGNGHDSIRFKNRVNSDGGRDTRTDIEQITFADGTVWTGKTLNDMALTTQGTSGNDTLNGWEGRDTMLGGAGDDTLSGRGGDDVLLGGDGNDLLDGGSGSNRLEGGAGNDVLKVSAYYSSDNVLSGGTGDDTLYGSIFADTYLFNQGDGHDTIVEQGGTDKLVLGAGIVASDVKVLREGQDVVLDLGNGHDSIRLKDWLTSDGYRSSTAHIEQIVFADGTVWTGETLSDIGLTTVGTSGDNTLQGWQGRDILLGGAGDDVLSGGAGTNRLEGGAGNDVLKVSAYYSSDNVLSGGTGDDTLYGSNNSDTYLFEKGDGHDTLVEQGGTDRLVFGEGLHREEALFTKSGDDLSILFNHGDDQVTVAGWFSTPAHQVESFVFQDGTVLSGEVERLIAAMAMPSAVTTTQATVRDTNEHHLLVASSIV
ncbi:calcium-binding protein [Xylella taiwanensis]|uniref:Calcium-binding protein n=4 Tax=Xylella taiwanensis TaxID=1444770 RepID=A0ABS8TVV5_9GAMM|nr:calcium-binding protein [Xylella taiwanensis]MCD8460356.1 calcium-binding protein [Xylella taiwanensis]MCD8464858.1 calcium-binding protein [Xylella taiwanensis]MCD8473151.1 calcium-binding protein [Xylella taiwanensis]